MSAFTANDLSKLFEVKGYTGLTQFYSPSFEFSDTIEAGLKRVQQEFSGQQCPNTFSLSSYPVWNGQGAPYVSSYISCAYQDEQFSIRLLDLSYNNGTYNGELSRQLLKEPETEKIPDKQYLSDTLRDLTAPVKELSKRNSKRFKL
ncbi:hypothetical protein GR160_07960 [Flavobacterium sp. Sd200]|uniref:hypothetical protein n=1 Tax=Flavobacterium sp. Sd200 TaxID=2692211 RepID=UPI0013688FCE|nr:hypothetical protein [Flavobacterium sp. Sd200]MXN91164.1 hypothetical protein [Flavobacterium sp. Sd200]